MAEPWAPEHEVTLEEVTAWLAESCPDLAGEPLERLGSGFDNAAFLVGGAWVFRFPRRAFAVPFMETEIRALPALAGRLPCPIPHPVRAGRMPSGWPFAGYRFLPGRTADCARLDAAGRERLAGPLARFVAALHAIPPGDLGLPVDPIGKLDPTRHVPAALSALDELSPLLEPRAADTLRARLGSWPTPPKTAVVVHGDLYARHLLLDDAGELSAVIDWGDLQLNDPAVDLAVAHLLFAPPARARFLAAYGPVDDATWRLAGLRATAHALATARYARAVADAPLLEETLVALGHLVL